MILSAILTFIFDFINYLFSFLPTNTVFPAYIHTFATTISDKVYLFNPIFPIDEMITVTKYSFYLMAIVISFKTILWIIHYIRGVSHHA